MKKIIEIKEEVQIENIILEKGDKLLVEDRRIPTFATENDTANWILVVDGFFQAFSNKEELNKVASLIKEEHFDDSPFGSMNILPPFYKPEFINDLYQIEAWISKEKEIDLENYITKQYQKRNNYASPKLTKFQQYQQQKAFNNIFYTG